MWYNIFMGVVILYSIREAAKILGVSEEYLRLKDVSGEIVPLRTLGGHRRYTEDMINRLLGNCVSEKIVVGYCRVSTQKQEKDLENQVNIVSNYCVSKGYKFRIIKDIGSGLNCKKHGLMDLIELIYKKEVSCVVVNYKDRLLRFGYELVEKLCVLSGVELEVINQSEDKTYEEELVEDVLSVVTVFSARLYGSRSHKNKELLGHIQESFKNG